MSKSSLKTSISDLLHEYVQLYMQGVPNFKLRALTDDFIENLRNTVKTHIQTSRTYTPQQQSDAYAALNISLKNIEERLNDAIDDELRALLHDL